jgi:vitamin B12 transporter
MQKSSLAALVMFTLLLGGNEVLAAEASSAALPSYTLPGIVVTAHRYSKKDVDTPASTNVITKEEIKDTGAANAQEVLRTVSGLVSETSRQGGGAINPASNSEIVIRGIAGTLVLVNGMPLNLNNRYELSDIPTEDIERIEVVKGGGSVLYGSEAIGGVINIITKKTRENSVYTGWGNQGRQNHGLSVQAGKLGVGYDYSKFGGLDHNSYYNGKYNDTGNAESQNFNASYQFNKAWRLNLSHNGEHHSTNYMGPDSKTKLDSIYDHRVYDTRKDFIQLLYDDHQVKGTLYYNYADIGYADNKYRSTIGKASKTPTYSYTKEKNSVYGGDLQKIWNTDKSGKFLLGGEYKHEKYLPDANADSDLDYSRNIYSIYGQWDKNLDKTNNLILSTRGTWTGSAPDDKNFHNISSQVQFLHKLDKNQSLYASVGQSFKMPTFKQILVRQMAS